ncbi:MAG: isoprenylcysteine carboxylmethyltransferase family protein [Anaerolineales bacterium]
MKPQIFLSVYLVIYFGLAFFWRTYQTWKATGQNPYTVGSADNAHDYVGGLFRLTMLAVIGVVGVYTFWPAGYAYLTPISWLEYAALDYVGMGLLILSLIWILIAQAQMGKAWRIGIDPKQTSTLVQTGVFGLSRNPIFLGMRLTILGLFLVIPNAVTLTILVLGNTLIQIQVRLEEEFLGKTYGESYRTYRQQVRRWL